MEFNMVGTKKMFIIISIILALIVSSSSVFAMEIDPDTKNQTEAYVEYLPGDVDGSGVVDVNDVTVYQLTLAGVYESTDAYAKNANTYTDKTKNIRDVTAIQLYLIGTLRKLPITPDGYYSEILRP